MISWKNQVNSKKSQTFLPFSNSHRFREFSNWIILKFPHTRIFFLHFLHFDLTRADEFSSLITAITIFLCFHYSLLFSAVFLRVHGNFASVEVFSSRLLASDCRKRKEKDRKQNLSPAIIIFMLLCVLPSRFFILSGFVILIIGWKWCWLLVC